MNHRLMKKYKKRISIFAVMMSVIMFALAGQNVSAATGNVYTCKITASYQHPVTGKIEDSGGSQSKATGQGMVEGSVFSRGLMEVTQSGETYLTFRMSLIDYTSKHSFSVQKRGASGWSNASVVQTASGKDNNGKTADLRMKIPSKDCIIRCSMYVNSMGRNVIFYFYPSSVIEGNSVGMKALIVTEQSSQTSSTQTDQAAQTGTNKTTANETTAGNEAAQQQQTATTASSADEALNDAQGLSLSTAPKTTSKKDTSNGNEKSTGTWILILTVSMTLSGLILLGVAAAIVYYYRKNWERWGADKDEYDEFYNEK